MALQDEQGRRVGMTVDQSNISLKINELHRAPNDYMGRLAI
jgi:hypothetical protein